jgi:hypothetical protein
LVLLSFGCALARAGSSRSCDVGAFGSCALREGDSEDLIQPALVGMIFVRSQLAAACNGSRFILMLQKVANLLDQLGDRLEGLDFDTRQKVLGQDRARRTELESATSCQLEGAAIESIHLREVE